MLVVFLAASAARKGLYLQQIWNTTVCLKHPVFALIAFILRREKTERRMLLLFSKTQEECSRAWFVIVIQCSLTYSLKTWSFWILIKHHATSQGGSWQSKLIYGLFFFLLHEAFFLREAAVMDKGLGPWFVSLFIYLFPVICLLLVVIWMGPGLIARFHLLS